MARSQQAPVQSCLGLPAEAPASAMLALQLAGWQDANLRIGMPEKAAGEGVQWNFRQ